MFLLVSFHADVSTIYVEFAPRRRHWVITLIITKQCNSTKPFAFEGFNFFFPLTICMRYANSRRVFYMQLIHFHHTSCAIVR